ncbi:MAG: SMP-30/gluconolactonase/LRE family protein [Gemmatimonadota bacterium]
MNLRYFVLACAVVVNACSKAPKPSDTATAPHPAILTAIGGDSSHIEGLAVHGGKLFVADWHDGAIYSVDPTSGNTARVGKLPTLPNQGILGVATDSAGSFYAAIPDSGVIYKVDASRLGAADFDATRDATRFATGVLGANGINFDDRGHLWITGGDHHAVYQVPATGGRGIVVVPDVSPQSTDTTMPVRVYTANGVAFDSKGRAYVVNTGTGAIQRITVDSAYHVTGDTLWLKDDRLIGADGVIADAQDNLWIAANFRNALLKVSSTGEITEISANGAGGPLHFPAELKQWGGRIYLANLNFPIGANTGTTDHRATIAVVPLTP